MNTAHAVRAIVRGIFWTTLTIAAMILASAASILTGPF